MSAHELCPKGCFHPCHVHSAAGCEHPGCGCVWVPLGPVLKRMLPEERENELREALGAVKLTYTGPLLDSQAIREIQRGVTLALDGMGVANVAPPNAAVMAGTIEKGMLEINVRVPIDLLRVPDEDDLAAKIRESQRLLERAALGVDIRRRLRGTFREWRRRAPVEEPDGTPE